MLQYLVSLIRSDERGQGLAEYALILALIAVLAIAAVTFLGDARDALRSVHDESRRHGGPRAESG
jgi:Flp pilus assembly pilin Flp